MAQCVVEQDAKSKVHSHEPGRGGVGATVGAVVGYTGMLKRIITPVINLSHGPEWLALVAMLTSVGLNFATADPYPSIVLAGSMFRNEYIKERLKPVLLSASMADSGTITGAETIGQGPRLKHRIS